MDSFLPKSPPQTSVLQALHNHLTYCKCCFSGRLLVCFGSSRLTQHCSRPARNAVIVYLWWFGGAVMPCLCHLLRLPLRVWNTGSFWLFSNRDFTRGPCISTHKTDEACTVDTVCDIMKYPYMHFKTTGRK